jgi:hypothetical protein
MKLEEPESTRWELLVLEQSQERPERLHYVEV